MAIPKASINPLSDLYDLIEKGNIQKDIEFRGKKYRFRSLYDEDYTWRDQFVNMNGAVALISSQRSPTLAIATVAIDDVPVEQIDELCQTNIEVPLALKDFVAANEKYIIAYNLHKNLFSKLPRNYIEDLYELFLKEVDLPSKTVKEEDLKNS